MTPAKKNLMLIRDHALVACTHTVTGQCDKKRVRKNEKVYP